MLTAQTLAQRSIYRTRACAGSHGKEQLQQIAFELLSRDDSRLAGS